MFIKDGESPVKCIIYPYAYKQGDVDKSEHPLEVQVNEDGVIKIVDNRGSEILLQNDFLAHCLASALTTAANIRVNGKAGE